MQQQVHTEYHCWKHYSSSSTFLGVRVWQYELEKAWRITDASCITNKIKEVSFKILHRIDPAKHVLERFKLNINYSCDFCGLHKETIIHLFFECRPIYCKIFWIDVQNYIFRETGQSITLNARDVCVYLYRKLDSDIFFVIQFFIIMGKYHTHKMKWAERKPNFPVFLSDINLYIKSISAN